MYAKVGRFFRTIRYLNLRQIVYQFKYRVGIPGRLFQNLYLNGNLAKLNSFEYLRSSILIANNPYEFRFLNQSVTFRNDIDWNYEVNGKLWTYNLNYFDFLNNSNNNPQLLSDIVDSFYFNYNSLRVGREAYPTSLRIMNIVKVHNNLRLAKLEIILRRDIERLYKSLEYHLEGNHLLENAFALYFAAHVYPREEKLVNKSVELIKKQLSVQILEDGGHYERSFMYHQIILQRLLESISLSNANPNDWNIRTLDFLKESAKKMLSWLYTASNGGEIFLRFNDSIENVGPNSKDIFEFAHRLKLNFHIKTNFSDSSFRKMRKDKFLFVLNVGEISPSDQPGHSHAETFNFCVFKEGHPIIVSPGITTYENLEKRQLERSSKMHNTLSIGENNCNEVWSLFRVGRRAKINLIHDSPLVVKGTHDGFKNLSIKHTREWRLQKNALIITDDIIGKAAFNSNINLHFFPGTNIIRVNNSTYQLENMMKILFETDNTQELIKMEEYQYSLGFNRSIKAIKLIIPINNRLITSLILDK